MSNGYSARISQGFGRRIVMKIKLVILLMFTVAFSIAGTAEAAPVQLGNLEVAWYSQQDSPCFIGYSCGPNEGIAYTTYSANNQGTDLSPLYTVGNANSELDLTKLIGEVGLTPLIAIDINQDGKVGAPDTKYQIDYIKVIINGSPAYIFDQNNDPTLVPQSRTGNGVSDYVIPGLDLTGATSLQFEVKYGNFTNEDNTKELGDNNDGKELFFLVKAGTTQVPEPMSLLLLGFGLVSLAGVRRFRK
jgi:hypothetical protein